jgi:large subunit ribosomal protein L1
MQTKKTISARERIEKDRFYTIEEAVALAKDISNKKFDETVEVALRLGIDPKHADQSVRGTVVLPHGTGKTSRVIVFAVGEKADQAKAAGADEVGGDELVAKVAGGWTDFDVAVATPDLMGKVGTLGRVLGPRGLMPNPKTGTVTLDTAQAVSEIKGGKIEFRADRNANLHFVIGKVSFPEANLVENFQTAWGEIQRHKPSSVKGRYIEKAVLSTTMSPGIPLVLA